jgi:peroxiredoxin
MDAYRDQYAKLFNNGDGVQVFGISADADTALASWAKDKGYPVTFLSDLGTEVGKQYGVSIQTRIGLLDNRTLYVIDKHGKIAHVMAPFRESDPTAYTELAEAVAKARAVK